MFVCEKSFNYVDKVKGVTKDGEQYISVKVIDPEDNKNYSFYSTEDKVISKFNTLQIARFSEITLYVEFENEFNQKTRYSNWKPYLVGVK